MPWRLSRSLTQAMTAHEPIQFTRGVPTDEALCPDTVGACCAAALKKFGADAVQYGTVFGFSPLLHCLADWYEVEADHVLASNSSLQIFDLLCQVMLQPGDSVLTEVPTYDRAIAVLRRHGAEIHGIPLGHDGPSIEQLEAMVEARKPRFFYLIPDFQNPSGITYTAEKRDQLIGLARKHRFTIIEDTPYRLLRYRGADEPSLFSMAPDLVVHIMSFSKLVVPGTRVGILVGDPTLIKEIAVLAENTYLTPGILGQAIICEFLTQGFLEPQIQRLKSVYRPRLEACLNALDEHLPAATASRPDGGFFVSLELPTGVVAAAVREEASKNQLTLTDGTTFFPNGGGERFLRLPFCSLEVEQIVRGIRRLGVIVDAQSGRSGA
jgi:2-aminoadipate transaminase